MRTVDAITICPYTGLRSFTEEESLYFKGRDLQIDQITSLLEQNKFLMVTGASGEGKSSLIYAGLIPNARAGFFRSKYSNWIVADFRPERSPVRNMALSLAAQFNSSPETVETELRRGYSSLIDLYTNSEFYAGDMDQFPDRFTEQEKKERKRKSANLILIVDQFEEFFTNPENFFNEATSRDSQIAVNLILETARIAIARNLPVYVVCTMRSDYIGQCSAFRGLPEYIGFSQFFVPRLKRKDLKQVIEEPALLAGLHISQRLIERLVFDISDGVDQLPILQHALSRIWTAAKQGTEELDLIHYAMVGGMPPEELPDEDIPTWRQWFDRLPEKEKKLYHETGLDKIIEIHANLLYENAWEYYTRRHPGSELTQQDAKRIVALSFSCLTKIDNSRAVRNRMSLEEIVSIINTPKLDTAVVGGVLNIFREEGNSFIRPFKTDDPSTQKLLATTVLDITHESLIRNWNKLNQWANKEFEFYSTFLDFKKQLDRWKESGKRRGYLLPVGPLTYFENWYNNCKPNRGWIMRYAEAKEDPKEATQHAEETLTDTREFLRRSASKEAVTRAFMKYGPGRIATICAILVMVVLSGFYWYNADQKKNERVIERVRDESATLLKSKKVALTNKADYLLMDERFKTGTLLPYLQSLEYKTRLSLTNEVYKEVLAFEKREESPMKTSLFELLAHDLGQPAANVEPQFLLGETNKFLIDLAMDQYYKPDQAKEKAIDAISKKDIDLVLTFFRTKSLFHATVSSELNMAIQLWLAVGKATPEKIKEILGALSPLAGKEAESVFNLYYSKGSYEPDGRQPMDFNGGYLTLACLYAANGSVDNTLWCFQQLLDNNQRAYFELARILNNHLNVLEYFYQYGHRAQVPAFLQWIAKNTEDNPPVTVFRNAVIRSGYISHMYFINIEREYYRSTRGYLYPNLCLASRSVFDEMVADYENAIRQMKDPAARDFNLAMNFKRKAVYYHKYWYDRQMKVNEAQLDLWLKQALEVYNGLSKDYLEGTESSTMVYNGDGVRTSDTKRKNLFLYPDYRDGWFSWSYHSDYFFNYLLKNGLLSSLFVSGEDLQLLHFWVAKAHELKIDVSPMAYSNPYPLPDETLKGILDFVNHHPQGRAFDRNLICLVLANRSLENGDTAGGLGYYQQLDLATLSSSSDKYEYLEKVFFVNMVNSLVANLAVNGKNSEVIKLIESMPTDVIKNFGYNLAAEKLYLKDADPASFVFLDSTFSKAKNFDLDDDGLSMRARIGEIKTLSEVGSSALNQKATDMLRNVPEGAIIYGTLFRVGGIAREGNYYRALTSIPDNLTETQDLDCRAEILLQASMAKEKTEKNDRWKEFDNWFSWFFNYVNYIPN